MNDKTLCLKLANGDSKAFGLIVDKYSGYVCAVARNFARGALSEQDIDDISVEVFFRLWNCRHNINADIGLRPYLSAAARNAVKNRFKQAKPPAEDISELNLPSDLFVEEKAELNEIMRCLSNGLETLADDEREIFFRFYFYGEKSSQIALDMKLPENTVYTKLRRTRIKLKNYLTERGFDHV